jgi:PBP1b-binding outer membrane lipoprotein LpoB
MKKYICILASAALLVACENKNENAAPVSSPAESTVTTMTTTSPAESPAESPMATMSPAEAMSPAESSPMETMTPAGTEGTTMESTTATTEASPTP